MSDYSERIAQELFKVPAPSSIGLRGNFDDQLESIRQWFKLMGGVCEKEVIIREKQAFKSGAEGWRDSTGPDKNVDNSEVPQPYAKHQNLTGPPKKVHA